VTDYESGESMERMEEMPLKNWGGTRGRPEAYLMTQIAYSEYQEGKLRMLFVNRELKSNSFRECALKIAVTSSTFQPKMD